METIYFYNNYFLINFLMMNFGDWWITLRLTGCEEWEIELAKGYVQQHTSVLVVLNLQDLLPQNQSLTLVYVILQSKVTLTEKETLCCIINSL